MTIDFSPDGVTKRRFFFGHQSVGENILEGVASLKESHPDLSELRVVEAGRGEQVDGPAIYHAKIGRNRDVRSKLQHFEELMIEQGIGKRVDAALMKLCYVDISQDSDPDAIFAEYAGCIQRIKTQLPKVTIVHCTIPLTVNGPGFRRKVRNWIRGDLPNIHRSQYNRRLRREFAGEPLFDIAQIEATRPNGSLVAHRFQGSEYHTAWPGFTEGAGHLNTTGRLRLAEELLRSLAPAPGGKGKP
jgi:hypothetical protein